MDLKGTTLSFNHPASFSECIAATSTYYQQPDDKFDTWTGPFLGTTLSLTLLSYPQTGVSSATTRRRERREAGERNAEVRVEWVPRSRFQTVLLFLCC